MKYTAIQQRHADADYAKSLVLNILDWDEEQYHNFQFEAGIAYLQAYIPGDPEGIKMLSEHKMFWSWWRMHWINRDFAFLPAMRMSRENSLKIYLNLHDPISLAVEIRPNSIVLGNSYAVMIGEILDSSK